MVDAGRPKSPLTLSAAERAALADLVSGSQTPGPLRLRCRIVLACATGRTNAAVAGDLQVTPGTVGKWRRRFVLMGLAGLDDGVRSGRPRVAERSRIAADERDRDGFGAVDTLVGRDESEDEAGPNRGAGQLGRGAGQLDESPERPLTTRKLADLLGVSQSTAARRRRDERQRQQTRPVRVAALPPPTRPRPTPDALLSDRVYETIRGWILSGELAPGMRVIESEIARLLGTSQAPAREAVRRLAHEGLVTHRPRLGNFVTVISQVEAREAREIRVLLETTAARRAAGHLADAELALLRNEVQRMREAAERSDIGAFREADMRFHRQVCGYSGNAMLLRIWRMLEATWWNLQVVSSATYTGDWDAMALRHGDLVTALQAGDPYEAARLFSAHARGESSVTEPARPRSTRGSVAPNDE